ncbi:sn-glycerol-3-phosphate ABC transporter ATP-binding protein UgpC [Ancylobacter sp. 6x-1]|uniref:Sn-glycerol-3-phosphate ABC transporter ATP-binding protein UgpC n=1 Tax=Ancylobacter crimeensis TaxID=2579147 RepID=A0ABT0D825_9HYPH|nr:sn-glycerol-3-phosphate ABC transporter ATP-binding protein UgpC [Ancylobacter crimeensis]MCK0196101.1 sn-glycerol-3-phosphate ABC transporter ATP-binding protein UgpC [Ancylobacter crimeensis]
MSSIELDHVSKLYASGAYGVRDVDLTIGDGEFVIFLGPSGCGKSTTLRMIAGLESITSGDLRIGGRSVTHVPPRERNIAVVFQSYALYPHMSVRENMGFGLKMRGTPRAVIEEKIRDAAQLLGLAPYLDRKPAALSGGQRQRVALGRAIVRDPVAFLLDEPLSNLDAQLRAEMRLELVKLHRRLGRTIVHVTHDQVEAMTMGDRICIMRDGRMIQVGKPLEVYADPVDTFVARFLATPPMNLIPARLEGEGDGLVVKADGIAVPVPEMHRAAYAPAAGREVILGLRPEDLHETAEPGFARIEVTVVAMEALGVENILVGQIGWDKPVEIAARLSRHYTAPIGARVPLYVDARPMHLFDPETTRALPRPRLAPGGGGVILPASPAAPAASLPRAASTLPGASALARS